MNSEINNLSFLHDKSINHTYDTYNMAQSYESLPPNIRRGTSRSGETSLEVDAKSRCATFLE